MELLLIIQIKEIKLKVLLDNYYGRNRLNRQTETEE